jgi:hypothetical protein
MLMLQAGAGALDYFPCRYGSSRAVFRGPERDLSRPYIAMLGGSPTFGKYVAVPYPTLVEQALGHPVANLAGLNAGPDFYLSDAATLDIAAQARVAVVQVTGAEALSNPMYSVHARRNDRFLTARDQLRDLYPEVEFTDIHFTRHLLQVLDRADPLRFRTVVATLKTSWVQKMRALMDRLPRSSMILWLAEAPPPETAASLGGTGPLFVDRQMLASLGCDAIEVVPSTAAWAEGEAGLLYPETEAAQARCLPGMAVHTEVAQRLTPALRACL